MIEPAQRTRFRILQGTYLFTQPRYRPPLLDEMMPDIARLMNSVASRYSDRTSAPLHFDEMVGECRLKLAELIDKGKLEQIMTRAEFFKFLKASFNNMARSRVQKYRFTEKRTGIKPPPRQQRVLEGTGVVHAEDEEESLPTCTKNVELSMDDPDSKVQVADQDHGDFGGRVYNEIKDDFESLMNETEVLVFRQMISPGVKAVNLATLDARRGYRGGKLTVRIRHDHLAESIGMSSELFNFYVLSIRKKIMAHQKMTDEDHEQHIRFNAALSQLKEVFGLQIPQETDEIIIRRLLTMAARDQMDKVNGQVEELLMEVGAKAPLSVGDKISCYGVLYARNNPRCNRCSLRQGCMVESVNIGMENIQPSVKLLGARQIRVPVMLPEMEHAELPEPETSNIQSATALDYVREHFHQRGQHGSIFYTFREGDIPKKAHNRIVLLCVDEHLQKIRLCGPSSSLRKRLVKRQKGWYLPDDGEPQELISLIDQHAKEVMQKINATF